MNLNEKGGIGHEIGRRNFYVERTGMASAFLSLGQILGAWIIFLPKAGI